MADVESLKRKLSAQILISAAQLIHSSGARSVEATQIRDQFSAYFSNEGAVDWVLEKVSKKY